MTKNIDRKSKVALALLVLNKLNCNKATSKELASELDIKPRYVRDLVKELKKCWIYYFKPTWKIWWL